MALAVLAVGLSMIILDATIVNTALPVLIADLNLSLDLAQWVNSLYTLVFASLLLTTGRLGDMFGRRLFFALGVLVFMAGSALASAADGGSWLLWARLVQGIGGALVLPSTLSVVNATFRGRDRVIAFAVWGAVISGMAAVGPLLGGWITTQFTWPWIFLVNLPIGALVLLGTWWVVPESRDPARGRGLDYGGLVLSIIGFSTVIFAIIQGPKLGWWTPTAELRLLGLTWPATAALSAVPVCGLVGVVALAAFVGWEALLGRRGKSVILDLSLFRLPTFSGGTLTATMMSVGELGALFVLPLYLVNVLRLSTLGAGYVLAIMAVGTFLAAGLSRRLVSLIGVAWTVVIGLVVEIVGIVAVALVLSATVPTWQVTVTLLVYGFGLGLTTAQLTGLTLSQVPAAESGQGSATQSTVRQLGGAIGTAVAGTILSVGVASAGASRLEEQGVAAPAAQDLADAARSSAGGAISALREQGTTGELGPRGPEVVTALSEGFADASAYALYGGAGFLALGLLGAVALALRPRAGQEPSRGKEAASKHFTVHPTVHTA
ncbi:DHA2 family efflux MFS transporter permease subunit [Rhodococcus sp. X156]|uniref:DHA2 family efflux MFS transporter permease subunit n=1 Tax=Rhodococcus sp. X156 TaxID=2499145 RepID=UPI001F496F02|nr:DHA2 family efflux MFS transporter permease subunit [Rhodococcus sp. X156]